MKNSHYSRTEIGKHFSVKGQIVNVFGLWAPTVSVKTTQVCFWGRKKAVSNSNGSNCVPVKLYIEKQAAGKIWPLLLFSRSLLQNQDWKWPVSQIWPEACILYCLKGQNGFHIFKELLKTEEAGEGEREREKRREGEEEKK